MTEGKPLTLAQFFWSRWRGIALFTIGWSLLVFLVFPHWPAPIVNLIYSACWAFAAYQLGGARERARWIREEQSRREEFADLEQALATTIEAIRKDAREMDRKFLDLRARQTARSAPN